MKKSIIFSIISISTLFLLYFLSPASLTASQDRFVININETTDKVVERLKNEKYIRSRLLMRILLPIIRFPGEIEPGAYMLSKKMTLPRLAYVLLNKPFQKWIVIPPGYRKEQTAEIFGKKLKWSKDITQEFINEAEEGYLYPDSYLINVDSSASDAIDKLINNFNEKFDSEIQKKLLEMDVRNDTAIKIASLIERESGGDEDKALIAGIIWNRIDKGMRLQIDAATQYILGKSGNWWPRVTPNDHKTPSLYNTYLNKGLMPSPICSPSLASIKAVAYPEETDCLFYIHDKNKQIHCAKTYEGHLRNVERYLK